MRGEESVGLICLSYFITWLTLFFYFSIMRCVSQFSNDFQLEVSVIYGVDIETAKSSSAETISFTLIHYSFIKLACFLLGVRTGPVLKCDALTGMISFMFNIF